MAISCQELAGKKTKDQFPVSNLEDISPPEIFNKLLLENKRYIKDYGEWWWQLSGPGIFTYAQISTRYITPRYSFYINYDKLDGKGLLVQKGIDYFVEYYADMQNWISIRNKLKMLKGQDYDDNIIYLQLVSIIKEWEALKNVNLYNSIPYFDAFSGDKVNFSAEYNNPKAIYINALKNLKEIGDGLPGIYNKMSREARDLLKTQDIALSGNIENWVKYTNALRLRYAVMLSGVDEHTASNHINDVLGNLPEHDLTFPIPDVHITSDMTNAGTYQRGLYENPFVTFISNIIINRMNFHELIYEETIDDPRLPVLALPTKYNDYRGVSFNANALDPVYKAGDKYYPWADDLMTSSKENGKSMWSHVTYTHNTMEADMFTLAEVDLLLAEVALKKLAPTGKTAGEHLKDAIIHSTDFWYRMNALSDYGKGLGEPWEPLIRPTKPTENTIASYAGKAKNVFESANSVDDKMEIIMQQKYIHINLLQPLMLWGELRRTRHPKLEKLTFEDKIMAPSVERLMYPSSELDNNTDNFLKVANQNNWTSPIFNSGSASYYREGYVTFKKSTLPNFD